MSTSRLLTIHVSPHARETKRIAVREDGSWKVALAATPERDHANKELIRFLAAHFRVAKECIAILRGKRSRHKVVRIQSHNSNMRV